MILRRFLAGAYRPRVSSAVVPVQVQDESAGWKVAPFEKEFGFHEGNVIDGG